MTTSIQLEQVLGSDPLLRQALADASLPTEDLLEPNRRFFKATSQNGDLLGFSGVELCDGCVLLRSVVVLPGQRQSGLGKVLVEKTLQMVGNPENVFLVTKSAAPFFERLGFIEVPRGAVPASILATRQLSSICPASATVMRLKASQ